MAVDSQDEPLRLVLPDVGGQIDEEFLRHVAPQSMDARRFERAAITSTELADGIHR